MLDINGRLLCKRSVLASRLMLLSQATQAQTSKSTVACECRSLKKGGKIQITLALANLFSIQIIVAEKFDTSKRLFSISGRFLVFFNNDNLTIFFERIQTFKVVKSRVLWIV
jgi:hypothetical protein